jgi:putative transcriptional regulator
MSRIVQGAREEALAMARGEADPNDCAVNIPETIDVRRIRKKLGMTQAAFAGIF